MRRHLEAAGTVAVIIAALAVAFSVVRREFFAPPGAGAASGVVRGTLLSDRPTEPMYLDAWRDLLELGTQMGSESASADVLVFVDLQCPYCQRFHEAYKGVKAQLGDDSG